MANLSKIAIGLLNLFKPYLCFSEKTENGVVNT